MDSASGLTIGEVLEGGYRVERLLKRGGMGAVFVAQDLGRGTRVAIKVILPDQLSGSELARFSREAQLAARVDQGGGVVRVHHFGTHHGLPYCVMELVEGQDLKSVLAAGPLEPARLARILEQVSRTLARCHAEGIVHRDLKPANVLIQPNDAPKLADFGLARDQEGGRLTHTGELLGTPSYMSPEQVADSARATSAAVDVYALGAILYHGLCGRPPFEGPVLKVLTEVVGKEPPRPSALVPEVPADLEAICRQAMAKRAEDRYPSAEALADDLARFQAGESVAARPLTRMQLLERRVGRRVLVASSVLGFLLLVAAVLIGVLALRGEPEPVVDEGDRRAAREEAQRRGLAQDRERLLAEPTPAHARRYLGATARAGVPADPEGLRVAAQALYADAIRITLSGRARDAPQGLRDVGDAIRKADPGKSTAELKTLLRASKQAALEACAESCAGLVRRPVERTLLDPLLQALGRLGGVVRAPPRVGVGPELAKHLSARFSRALELWSGEPPGRRKERRGKLAIRFEVSLDRELEWVPAPDPRHRDLVLQWVHRNLRVRDPTMREVALVAIRRDWMPNESDPGDSLSLILKAIPRGWLKARAAGGGAARYAYFVKLIRKSGHERGRRRELMAMGEDVFSARNRARVGRAYRIRGRLYLAAMHLDEAERLIRTGRRAEAEDQLARARGQAAAARADGAERFPGLLRRCYEREARAILHLGLAGSVKMLADGALVLRKVVDTLRREGKPRRTIRKARLELANLIMERADLLKDRGRYTPALKAGRQALAVVADMQGEGYHWSVRAFLAHILLKQRRHDEARAVIAPGVPRAGMFVPRFVRQAVKLAVHDGRRDDALAYLRSALRRHPKSETLQEVKQELARRGWTLD